VIVVLLASAIASAQGPCDAGWLPGEGTIGVEGTVYATTTWDLDGDGPLPAQLVVGGSFTTAGGVTVNNIARWDGSSWHPFGNGVSGEVRALTVWVPDGAVSQPAQLVAGGLFVSADGLTVNRIARWDGSSWHALGSGLDNNVVALTTWDPDGQGQQPAQLVAGGGFINAGGVEVNRIARWDGSVWQPLGSGMNGTARALATWDPDGDGPQTPHLIAGGSFTSAGGEAVSNVAPWDGTAWQSFGGGVNGDVHALMSWDPDESASTPAELVVGGQFVTAGGVTVNRIARWNGSSWQPFGTGMDNLVLAITSWDLDDTGPLPAQIVAAGEFATAGGVTVSRIARWDGTAWQPFGSGMNNTVRTLTPLDLDGAGPQAQTLVAAGQFTTASGLSFRRIASWDGAQWKPFGGGLDGDVVRLTTWDPDGVGPHQAQLVAGGFFTRVGSAIVNRVVGWDGPSLNTFGSGFNGAVYALSEWDPDASGPLPPQLIAGGFFSASGGLTLNNIASWDGANWQSLGGGMGGISPDVRITTTWDPDGAGPAVAQLVAGGSFTSAGGVAANRIARWNGVVWQPFGPGFDNLVAALTTWDPDADGPLPAQVVAAGNFLSTAGGGVSLNHVGRWDGAAWQPFGSGMNGPVRTLTTWDPDAEGPIPALLVAGGIFGLAGGVAASNIASWDGVSWSPLGSGTNGEVYALTSWDPDGAGPQPAQLVASGLFTTAGGIAANRIALWNGSSWQPFGSGMNSSVFALSNWDPDGPGPATPRLVAGGGFTQAGDRVSAYFAQWGRESVLWGSGIGGQFIDPVRWFCGLAPTAFDTLNFDATQAGYTPSSFTVTMPDGSGVIDAQGLNVFTDIVTLNLRNRPLYLEAPITVGTYDNRAATLVVRNTLGSVTEVLTPSASIGDTATTSALLNQLRVQDANARLEIAGDLYVGRRANKGEFVVQAQADAVVQGGISIGTQPGSVGEVRVQNAGSTLAHSAQGRTLAIGEFGSGTWTIGGAGVLGGATASSIGRMQNVILAIQSGSTGSALISGAGSSWNVLTQNFYIGYGGTGTLRVEQGALLDTDSFGEVVIGRFPGSSGTVTLRDAGSRWVERSQAISVGATGVLEVGAGTTVDALGLNVLPGGIVTGEGTLGSFSARTVTTDVVNFGTIRPLTDDGQPGQLSITGNYRQIGPPPDGGASDSGVLDLLVDSSGSIAASLNTTGSVELGGALLVRFPGGIGPPKGSPALPVLSGSTVLGRFDVAFFPRFSADPKDDRFLKVVYGGRAEAGIGISLEVDSLSNLLDLSSAQNFAAGGRPNAAALGDVDGDGDLDLAVVVPDADPEQDGRLVILFNQTNAGASFGGFQVGSIEYPTGPDPSAVAIGDLNVLPGPEIAITNRGADSVRLFNNNGGGIFTQAPSDLTVGAAPADVVIVDLDQDGVNDLVVANSGANTLASTRNLGGGAFGAPSFIIVGDMPVDIDPTDLDNDKDIDIVVVNGGSNSVSLVIGDGKGGLVEAASLPVGDEPVAVTVAFLDDDLFPDIVTTDRAGNTISVLRSQDALQYAPGVQLPVGLQPRSIVAVDLDNDGDLDLAVVADDLVDGPVVQVLRNDSPAGQLAFASAASLAAGSGPVLVLAGDVDNQGGADLVTINDATVLAAGTPGSEAGSMPPNDVSVLLNLPPEPCAGDTNGDNLVNGADLSVLLGQFGQSVTPGTGADFNGDGLVNGADLSVLLGRFGVACTG